MAHIRDTIDLFTKVLKENGTSKIKPEVFRLAKFDHEDAVTPLWKLLFELVYFCEFGKIDDVSIKACGELTTEELTIYVKRELQKRGFFSRDFADLPNDMSGGSRELLLAIGWLVCKDNIIQKFMHKCTSPLKDDTGYLYSEGLAGGDNPSVTWEAIESSSDENIVDKVQQLLWFNNKLQLSLRSLYAMKNESLLLKHKMHEATQGVSLHPGKNHLSMLEIYMLRHPEILQKNIVLLENDNERLQNLLKWKQHEDIFWKWMESVLDSKLKDKQGSSKLTEENLAQHAHYNSNDPFISPGSVQKLHTSHLDLQEAIVKYESIVEHLEKLWGEKSADISEEELDSVLSSIDLELSIQKANIALNNCDSFLQSQQSLESEPNFVLEKPSTKKVPNRAILGAGVSSPKTNEDTLVAKDIEEEIGMLQNLVNYLEIEVNEKQNNFKEEMQNLSAKFNEAICIPPIAQKF